MSDHKTASFDEFKAYTLAVVRGEEVVDPTQSKIWVEPVEGESSAADNPSQGRDGKLDIASTD